MRTATKARLAVVPEPSNDLDPVRDAQANVARCVEHLTLARDAMTAARKAELDRQSLFDSGTQVVGIQEVHEARVIRESCERKHVKAEEAEQNARIALAQAEAARAKGECQAQEQHAAAWPLRMADVLARLAAIDEEVARVVDCIADVISDARDSFSKAETLENVVRPILTMHARGVTSPSLADAKLLANVHIARVRAKAGRDELADGWIAGQPEPDWKDANRSRWNAVNAALDELEGKQAEVKS
jgi:hypothetical protein